MKKLTSLLSVLGIFLFLGTGCVSSSTTAVPQDLSIRYRAGGCYGTCPVYSVKIQADGTGIYEGILYVKTTGTQPLLVSKKNIEKLVREIHRIDFFSLKNEYIADATGDLGRRQIEITQNGQTKNVTFDIGPDELNGLIESIQETVKINRLIK